MCQNAEWGCAEIASLVHHKVDATGLLCPEPLMCLQKMIRAVEPGVKVLLVASDPTVQRDVIHYCHFLESADYPLPIVIIVIVFVLLIILFFLYWTL